MPYRRWVVFFYQEWIGGNDAFKSTLTDTSLFSIEHVNIWRYIKHYITGDYTHCSDWRNNTYNRRLKSAAALLVQHPTNVVSAVTVQTVSGVWRTCSSRQRCAVSDAAQRAFNWCKNEYCSARQTSREIRWRKVPDNDNNNNNTSICKAHNVSIRAESEAPHYHRYLGL